MLEQQYDKIADKFSSYQKQESSYRNDMHMLLNMPLRDTTILDLGCGDGEDLKFFTENGAKAYGIDLSKELLKIARQKAPLAELNYGDFSELPYQDNFFDLVYSQFAIHHAKDLEIIFREVSRVLKLNHYFLLLVPHIFRQFFNSENKNYFQQSIEKVLFFNQALSVDAYTHTLSEYLSPFVLTHFKLEAFLEKSQEIDVPYSDWYYPTYMIFKFKKVK